MGSKFRLLPWLHEVFSGITFDTALDAFSGSGCVSYLLKCMGKEVQANDFLNFSATLARATVENQHTRLTQREIDTLVNGDTVRAHFVEETFEGIFYTPDDLRFLDQVWGNLSRLSHSHKRALAIAALVRSCAKRQPRGVFTVAGDPAHYKDGRRDLRLSLREHFAEQVQVYNLTVFDSGRHHRVTRGDVFALEAAPFDLVYLDPPYVPRSDDNCYIKRYHFLEGISCYWDGLHLMRDSKVKKVKKRYTPFSYRGTAVQAFERMFARFSRSTIVLSYSSNGFPDLDVLVTLLRRVKGQVAVLEKAHRYHFGTHSAAARNQVSEYLLVGY